jgi:hypothetical protein
VLQQFQKSCTIFPSASNDLIYKNRLAFFGTVTQNWFAKLSPEVFVELGIVRIDELKIMSERFRIRKIGRVNVRVGWRDGRVVGPAQHYRNHVEAVDGEELLRHVVPAHGVLEGKVEFVLGLGLAVTFPAVFFWTFEFAT